MKTKSEIKTEKYFWLYQLSFAFAIIIASFSFAIATAHSSIELFTSANQFYNSKQFQQAADEYEKIIAQGFKNAEIYYNLGNCYYKLNNVSKSILAFERALKLSPKDEDIIHNLALARMKATDKIQHIPELNVIVWWNSFTTFYSSNGWSILALTFIWLSVFAFAIYLFMARKKSLLWITGLLLMFSLSFFALALHQKKMVQHSNSAILVVPSSYVKSSPDANGGDLFMIHEGCKLEVLDQVGEWRKIKLEDGKIGWIQKRNFEMI
ncbi:MAG: tetratricopeptide repeat protein [Chitinophagales bacterium]|nr:tetratricopeptide repeat protein [Chitinophagales bacterium]